MQEAHSKEPAGLRGLAFLDRVTLNFRAAGKQLPTTPRCPPPAPLLPPPSQSLLLHLTVTPQPAAIAFHATSEAAASYPPGARSSAGCGLMCFDLSWEEAGHDSVSPPHASTAEGLLQASSHLIARTSPDVGVLMSFPQSNILQLRTAETPLAKVTE